MVRINACVNDRNPGACAGVSGGPSPRRANHFRGGGHIRVCRTGRYHIRAVLGFQHHLLHPGKGFNFGNLPVFHVDGQNIRRQSQVPDDVRGFSSGRLHAGGHILLQLPQTPAVGRRLEIFCKMFGGKASCQGGGLLQHHGYPDQVRIQVVR